MGDNYFKVYQDFEPVVLTKTRKPTSIVYQQSKSNIHVNVKKDSDDIIPINYYSIDQINTIKQAREAAKLSQKDLSKKISPVLSADFIGKIEGGKYPYDDKTYNKILQVLNIKKNKKNS
jgi:ribosome-binding protein aMBF1 (putative translation factor)